MKTRILGNRIWLPVPRRFWSPRYVVDRVRLGIWQRSHPGTPWLVPAAVHFLDQWLRPGDTMVEFGSGRSTLWFSKRVGRLISLEHDAQWHATVKTGLAKHQVANVQYFLQADDDPSQYVAAAERALGTPADVILVDGAHRDACAAWSLRNIARNGIIVVDNANWFIPSRSRAPASLGPDEMPRTPTWRAFWDAVADWRRAWFSSGVTDTLVLFAPDGGPGGHQQ